jgi:ubiquinone/menaquinone biosynthesis C-methylase UbiE
MWSIMESLSFDSMADLYDETRVFDRDCFNAALDWLVDRFPPQRFRDVFYPGIGTGRVAIPLAEKGYHITGVDISERMLSSFEAKLEETKQSLLVSLRKADVTCLPFGTASFDMVIAVHLFYFIGNWQKAVDEMMRVLKSDGCLVLMHTGTGAEVPFLNERYRELCSGQGYSIQDTGVSSNREVVEYLEKGGYHVEWIRDRWQWTSHIRLNKALNYIRSRAYSFTISVPGEVHSEALNRLESETMQQFGGLEIVVEVPNQIYLVVVSHR